MAPGNHPEHRGGTEKHGSGMKRLEGKHGSAAVELVVDLAFFLCQ